MISRIFSTNVELEMLKVKVGVLRPIQQPD